MIKMSQQRSHYRPIPRRIPQGTDNSGLYGAAALATLAAGGYLGYRYLTKDNRDALKHTEDKGVTSVPVDTPPKKDLVDSFRNLWDNKINNKLVRKDGFGINRRLDVEYDLVDPAIMAATFGLGMPAYLRGMDRLSSSNPTWTEVLGKTRNIPKSYLKYLKSPKAVLAAALSAGTMHLGSELSLNNSIRGIRRSKLPNLRFDPKYRDVNTQEVLGTGLLLGGASMPLIQGFKNQTAYAKANPGAQEALLGNAKFVRKIGNNPKKALLALALLGSGGEYLKKSFE